MEKSEPHIVLTREENDRKLLEAWEDLRKSIIRLSRLFPDNPPPGDFEWEKQMDVWADLTRERLGIKK